MKGSNRSTSTKVRGESVPDSMCSKEKGTFLDLMKGILNLCREKDHKELEGVSVTRKSAR